MTTKAPQISDTVIAEPGEGRIISLNLRHGRVTYCIKDVTRTVLFTAIAWNEERQAWIVL